MKIFVMALMICVVSSTVFAVMPDERLADPVLEQRALNLTRELRCMVCQNQSIEDSDAPLARDLRMIVREKVQKGDSDEKIREALVERYGEFVLLNPRMSVSTSLLWAAPPFAILLGLFVAWRWMRSQKETGLDS